MNIERLNESIKIPYDLLEMADPSRDQITKYLETGTCYIVKSKSEIIGAMVLDEISPKSNEIKNIAIKEPFQGRGFGKALLQFAINISKKLGYEKLMIGTANSSIRQLELYQKQGFEIERIEKNFFINNYSNPIFENGIQCKHKIVLELNINN